jgi:hypothetical protein
MTPEEFLWELDSPLRSITQEADLLFKIHMKDRDLRTADFECIVGLFESSARHLRQKLEAMKKEMKE